MIENISNVLKLNYPQFQLEADIDSRGICTLRGECDKWQTVVNIGHEIAALPEVKNVVNELTVKGLNIPKKNYAPYIEKGRKIGIIDSADIVIVGAGVTGCGIARELSKYNLKIIVVEMNEDVATGATKANNGDIHPGYLEKPGSLKVKLNVRGNKLYDKWAEELGFEMNRCGNMVVITDEAFRPELEASLEQSKKNGVYAEIVTGERALELEPQMADSGINPVAALWVPSMAIVEPWMVTIALAENAVNNGVKFLFNCTVGEILTDSGSITGVVTERGIINTSYIINCAGVYADEISEMAGDKCYTIHPRRGTIAIFDKSIPPYDPLFRIIDDSHKVDKTKNSKGGGMGLTINRNILLGPSAVEVPDKENLETTEEELAYAMSRNCKKDAEYKNIIRIFAGSRPATYKEDFVIEKSPVIEGFINVGGIQSPGLASAPAIAEMVENILIEDMRHRKCEPSLKEEFDPYREVKPEFRSLSRQEQDELIARRPEYGRVVCRCETITEGEIIDAIHSPITPTSIDAIKRRTRSGMGRCQGGFCQPRILEILARELNIEPTEVNLKGLGTSVILKNNRE